MFSLRIINEDKSEDNYFIGKSYSYLDKDKSSELFLETFRATFDREYEEVSSTCYGFVVGEGFKRPLFRSNKAYIVTTGGATYDNLCYYRK